MLTYEPETTWFKCVARVFSFRISYSWNGKFVVLSHLTGSRSKNLVSLPLHTNQRCPRWFLKNLVLNRDMFLCNFLDMYSIDLHGISNVLLPSLNQWNSPFRFGRNKHFPAASFFINEACLSGFAYTEFRLHETVCHLLVNSASM